MQEKSGGRLYKELVGSLIEELSQGKYPLGARLPAERELALQYDVSRPTVREAIIALEAHGMVEVRVGSGAYVVRLPGQEDLPGFGISAFEITEARLIFEAEAAALAATEASDEDIASLDQLIVEIARENQNPKGAERADRAFHIAIAAATRNAAIKDMVERLWDLRASSPEAALLHEKARTANIKPVVDEHSAIVDAIRARDPNAARAAMRAHLSQVVDSLLFATEERQIADIRKAADAKRKRYKSVAA
jgi:GntR family transcriptional regulator, hexuronate regulon transcriptional repressor